MEKQKAAALDRLPVDERKQVKAALAQGRKKMDQLRQKKLRDKDFAGYLFTFSHDERFDSFLKIIPKLSAKEYWELLRELWMMAEVIEPDRTTWLRLLQSKRSGREFLMTKGERGALAKMPDRIEIWRGCGHAAGVRGLSWTLDMERAKMFASYACQGRRLYLAASSCGSTPIVARAICGKAHVLAFFKERSEAEIVINPKKLKEVQTFSLAGSP